MLINHFQLLRPWWLIALLPVTVILFRLWRYSHAEHHWRGICDPHLLPYLLDQTLDMRRRYYIALLGFCWVCSVIALSGPSWQRLPLSVYQTQQAQVVVLDLSDNMTAADIKPNRLTRARYKLLDILQHSKEQQTGLVVFTSKPFVVSPLTQDAATIAAMVPVLSPAIIPVQGEDIGAGLIQATKLLKQAGVDKGHIILITATNSSAKDEAIAAKIKQQGTQLSILGIGTALGAPTAASAGNGTIARLDSQRLKRLAKMGGGQYVSFSETNTDIESLIQATHTLALDAKKTTATIEQWSDQAYWLIFPLLLGVGLMFRRGWFEEITQ